MPSSAPLRSLVSTAWAACLAGTLGACADAAFLGDAAPSERDSATPSTATDTDTAATAPPAPATYYAVDAEFTVTGGELDPATTAITVGLWDADAAPLCRHTVPVLRTNVAAAPTSEPDLYAFWRLQLGDGEPDVPCAPFAARSLWIGLGPWDERLDPARVAAGLESATAYAAVVQETPGGPVWLTGIGGTANELAGYEDPVSHAPLPEGEYRMFGLVLLSL